MLDKSITASNHDRHGDDPSVPDITITLRVSYHGDREDVNDSEYRVHLIHTLIEALAQFGLPVPEVAETILEVYEAWGEEDVSQP